ncbi:MAG: septum site-determining protein MinC, partial [Steroidobacter sp.]
MNKANAAPEAPCEIRLGQVGLAQLRLRTTDPDAIHHELAARIAAAPQLFERTAVCLDLSTLEHEPAASELRTVIGAVRRAGFFPVGLVQGAPIVDGLARELDLPVVAQWRATAKPAL